MSDLVVKSGLTVLYRTTLGPGMDVNLESEDREISNAEGTTTKITDKVIQLAPGSGPTEEKASVTGGAVLMYGDVGVNAGNVRAPDPVLEGGAQGSPGSVVVGSEELTEESKEDLMARARELEVEGRSHMNKEELAAAVAEAEKK